MAERIFPRTAAEGFDEAFTRDFYARLAPKLERIFRPQVTGLENLDPERPAVLASNHNAGAWGIPDVMMVFHAWYELAKAGRPLSAISEKSVFYLPKVGPLAAKTGLKVPEIGALGDCLDAGHSVYVTPGANNDMLRPIWQKNRTRFAKCIFVKGRRIFRERIWYLDVALSRRAPIYPISISGTHEMTPILWESPLLLRLSGIPKLRSTDEEWSGFPITLNHLLNLSVFSLTPLVTMPWAWVVFLLANVYFDPAFFYPIFPFRLKVHIGEPVIVDDYPEMKNAIQKRKVLIDVHNQLVARVEENLERLDRERIWMKPWYHVKDRYLTKAKGDGAPAA